MFCKHALVSHNILFVLTFTISGCNFSEPNSPRFSAGIFSSRELLHHYESGKSLLLFAYSNDISAFEAYTDWAAYLNDFKQSQGNNFLFIRVVKADLNIKLSESDEFTLFEKKGYTSYLYEGLIVEPQVYNILIER